MNPFYSLIKEASDEKKLILLTFGGLRKKTIPYRKASVRPVLLKGELHYQVEYHYDKKVTHENLAPSELPDLCECLLQDDFKQANLFCTDGDYQVLASKADKPKIIKHPPTKELGPLSHNHEKQYLIPDGIPCDFLVHLGVMTPDGKVKKAHYNKFRQINRFLEIVHHGLKDLNAPKEPFRVIDFGCGKAYLTFALAYYFAGVLKWPAHIIGLDLKEDVMEFCRQTASELSYNNLEFLVGDIADYKTDRADMVVTLHACDTATDFALINAVSWGAKMILSVPCCQHELFAQIADPVHEPLLRHGILKDRIASILTDGLRCLKLEEQGYQIDLLEFTSLEHTAKNIMIRAVLPTGRPVTRIKKEQARKEYDALKSFWHVDPSIDRMG